MNTPAAVATQAPAALPPGVGGHSASLAATPRLMRGAYRVPTTGNGVAAPHLLSRGTVAVALTLARHDRSRS